jgi:glycogen debranching enzyme
MQSVGTFAIGDFWRHAPDDDGRAGLWRQDMRFVRSVQWRRDGEEIRWREVRRTGGGLVLESADGELRREVLLAGGTWVEQLTGRGKTELELAVEVDMLDVFALRGLASGPARPVRWTPAPGGARAGRTGLDGVPRAVRLRTLPTADRAAPGHFWFSLGAGPFTVTLALRPDCGEEEMRRALAPPSLPAMRAGALHDRVSVRRGQSRVVAEDGDVNRWLVRSRQDLALLGVESTAGDGPVLRAGVPWFLGVFGRDALVAGRLALLLTTRYLEAALVTLARTQGRRDDPAREEEVGRIAHELRDSELARAGYVPYGRYYGAVDTTPLYLVAAAELGEFTGQPLPPVVASAARRALGWLERALDDAPGGLLWMQPRGSQGLVIQSWKDSAGSMVYRDGRRATPPLAVLEVQGYVYRALRLWSRRAQRAGDVETAARLGARAEKLRDAIRTLYMPRRQTYAMALDGDGHPLDVISSDIGQALAFGLLPAEHRGAAAAVLMGPDLFSGWGVRTLGASEAAYDPDSYHNGSVWPHDTALAVRGLARSGFRSEAAHMGEALGHAAAAFGGRLPELFGGDRRRPGQPPHPYANACSPQAWAAAAAFGVLEALLGVRVGGGGVVTLDPWLPESWGRVTVHHWRIAGGEVSFSARGGRLEWAESAGEVRLRLPALRRVSGLR